MPDLSSVTSNFDLLGQLTNVTDAAGVSIYFNNQGLLVVSSNALAIVVTNKYDIFDRLTESTEANGVTVSLTAGGAAGVFQRSSPGTVAFGPRMKRTNLDRSDYSDHINRVKAVKIGTLEAKTHLSELLDQVQRGSRFLITKRGEPVAQLGPVEKPRTRRRAGFAKGVFSYVAPDFNAPLQDFADYR